MVTGFNTAFSKFLFCIRITASVNTLVKLLYNTKRLRWYKSGSVTPANIEEFTAYDCKINGQRRTVFLRTFQGDIDIFYEIFWKKIYSLPLQQELGYKVIVDIGANVGMAALYFATHYPLAQIICIEPDKDNCTVLQKNCAPYKNIKIMQAAIMPQDGFVSIKKALLQYNNSVQFSDSEKNNVQAICMNTLFSNFELTHVDLMKIDIEGGEEEVFAADTTWLDNVSQLLIEIHNPETSNVCFNRLQQHLFTYSPVNSIKFYEGVYWAFKNKC
jgi:FkbM family methyltransferase